MNSRNAFIIFIATVLLISGSSCSNCKRDKNADEKPVTKSLIHDFSEIRESGRIIVLTEYNSTSYFLYRGKPMGFHYELVKAFAEYLGVDIQLNVLSSLDQAFENLNDGKSDLLAFDLTKTAKRAELMDFTNPVIETHQVLVQRKSRYAGDSVEFIDNLLQLDGKTVYIMKGSSFVDRLLNLESESGIDINIRQVDMNVEQLILKVVTGEMNYTVADEHVALMNKTYYPHLDVATPISFSQYIAWAVPKGADSLRNEANKWLLKFRKTPKFKYLYQKYFLSSKHVEMVESELYSVKTGKISPYDEIFKFYSNILDWDWRIVASLAFQESRFHPEIISWAGARGIMQLMPETAKRFGADSNATVESQIKAGVLFLKYLDDYFMTIVPDKNERIKFVLAAYNAGPGHVMDARRLAEKYGHDSNVWSGNVDTFILLKSLPKYYHDPVVKYGYSRGEESFNFVKEILDRYELYKTVIR